MRILGIVFIIVGLFSLAYQGFTYTTREKVIDLGPIEATAERTRRIPLPPIFGVVAVIAGTALIFVGKKK